MPSPNSVLVLCDDVCFLLVVCVVMLCALLHSLLITLSFYADNIGLFVMLIL